MNVAQALSLRKPDRRFVSMGRQESSTQQNSRFNKKNNIRDILVRNFFRKYPIGLEVDDLEQIRIEKEVANSFEGFVLSQKEINSKNLNAFE